MKLQTKGMKIEEYDRERKETMKQYETVYMKDVKNMTEKEKRI
jgi:hypothetical protein